MSGTLEVGRHMVFVWAAYGATGLVLAGLLLDTWLRARRWKRAVEQAERERDRP